jgi:hypothetical protein
MSLRRVSVMMCVIWIMRHAIDQPPLLSDWQCGLYLVERFKHPGRRHCEGGEQQ